MKMRTARVHRIVRRIYAEGIFVIFILLLIIRPIYAAPTCPPKPSGENKIGFCGPNVRYHEWDCPSCPHRLGLSAKCGKVYPKVIKVECQPCKNGTYSDENSSGQCKPCTTTRPCQDDEVQIGQCKSDNNTLQCQCKQGYYRASTASCMPCSWCCRDKTNVYEAECQDLEKKCSYQDVKSCDPSTTYAPLNSTTATPVITRSNTTDTSNGSSTDIKETERKSSGIRKEWLIVILCLSSVLVIALASCIAYLWWKTNGNSSNQDLNPEVSTSSFTSSEQNSSALLITGKEESTTPEKNEKIDAKEEDHLLVQPRGSGTDRDEPVIVVLNKGTATYHIKHKGPNGEQTSLMANGTVPLPTTPLDYKEKLCFICEKLGPNISHLKYDVVQKLCEMLNVPIDGKDYRNLDVFCGLDIYKRKGLEQSQNPMEDIIEIMITSLMTLESFLKELYRISRGDVVQELYKIAKEKK